MELDLMRRHAYAISPEILFNEDLRTWANAVTLVRTIGGLILFSVAAFKHSAAWNLAGLAMYWGLDVLDGYLARALNQETRFGAQMDILADRFLVAFFYLNYLAMYPEMAVVIALFLFEFMVLDHYLSNQFMRWSLLSPNYFYVVDRTIWLLNWSPPGKFFNSGAVTILMLATRSVWLALPVLIGLICVKLYSCVRLHQLPPPEH
jgi:CDP-diacylglycerol--glycerol-3-phosphate 3-phosphatidyltransferase